MRSGHCIRLAAPVRLPQEVGGGQALGVLLGRVAVAGGLDRHRDGPGRVQRQLGRALRAIGTRLMTGSYIGFASMIALSGLPPTFVPSFSFLTDRGREPYRLEKAIEVMKAVFARRNKVWQTEDEAAIRYAREAAAEAER